MPPVRRSQNSNRANTPSLPYQASPPSTSHHSHYRKHFKAFNELKRKEKALTDLLRSLGKHQTVIDGIAIEEHPLHGYGLYTKHAHPYENAKSAANLITLPRSCLLIPSQLQHQRPDLFEGLNDESALLMLALITQDLQLDCNKWSPYIDLLPHSYSLPAFNKALYRQRLPASFREELADKRDVCTELTERVVRHIRRKRLNICIKCIELRAEWAFSVVNTRTIAWNGETVLMPFADLMNHSERPNATILSGGDINLLCVVPTRAISKGESLTINYEANESNRHYFINYNFVNVKHIISLSSDEEYSVIPSLHDIIDLNSTERFSKNQFRKLLKEYQQHSKRKLQTANILARFKQMQSREELIFRWPMTLLAGEAEYVIVFNQKLHVTIVPPKCRPPLTAQELAKIRRTFISPSWSTNFIRWISLNWVLAADFTLAPASLHSLDAFNHLQAFFCKTDYRLKLTFINEAALLLFARYQLLGWLQENM